MLNCSTPGTLNLDILLVFHVCVCLCVCRMVVVVLRLSLSLSSQSVEKVMERGRQEVAW